MDMSQFLQALPSLISVIVSALVAFLAFRGGMGKNTNEAQQGAITALNTELGVLRGRVTDQEKENARMQFTLDAINAALEEMGMVVTIRGKMVIIKDSKGASTTIHFNGNGNKKEEELS
jgi:hypothetical protein